MPDGWETSNGLNPRDGDNGKLDPDKDGWDRDGDGSVTYDDLVLDTRVVDIYVEIDQAVQENETVARGEIILAGGNTEFVYLKAKSEGFVYSIFVQKDQIITSRLTSWMEIV